jgi:hypothetical protein
MKIGTLKKTQFVRVNFKNWVKEMWREGIQRELPVVRIFVPNRFRNYTLIMEDRENGIEVSRTLSEELGKQLLKEFGFSIKRETPGTLYLIIHDNGDQEIERVNEKSKVYVYEGTSFVLRDIEELEKKGKEIDEDIPF